MYELSKQFRFEAAHTLKREIEAEGSRRVHGHSFVVTASVARERPDSEGRVVAPA